MSIPRVVHLNYSERRGGAARAARRIHLALRSTGAESCMRVAVKNSDEANVVAHSRLRTLAEPFRPRLGALFSRTQSGPFPALRSPAFIPSGLDRELNKRSAETVLNLHWINAELISIEEVGRLRGPVVWTLHDMWPFCGAEHYSDTAVSARWRNGYSPKNRPKGVAGIDIDRLTWLRKRRAWKRPFTLVCPTRWMADCAAESELMRDWPSRVIPNPLDVQVYRPHPKEYSREVFGLPKDAPIVLFGALGGTSDQRKGYDLLCEALQLLISRPGFRDCCCVVFGQSKPSALPSYGIQTYWMGHVEDDWTMALLYSAADVVAVPSRQESFGQTASEAQACGTPVVAFKTSGLLDIVEHQKTGYLADAFHVDDFAAGLASIIDDVAQAEALGEAARSRAVARWSYGKVAECYAAIYRDVLRAR